MQTCLCKHNWMIWDFIFQERFDFILFLILDYNNEETLLKNFRNAGSLIPLSWILVWEVNLLPQLLYFKKLVHCHDSSISRSQSNCPDSFILGILFELSHCFDFFISWRWFEKLVHCLGFSVNSIQEMGSLSWCLYLGNSIHYSNSFVLKN